MAIQESIGVHIHIFLFIKTMTSNIFVQAVLGGQRLRKSRNTIVTEIDLIIQFLWQFFVFLFYFKRSQSQDLGIRQLVSALQRQLFIFLVHDCYPPHTAERQSNPEVLILCNSVVCIPPHFPAKEFKRNLNSRLVFLAICFLICKKETSSKNSIVFTKTSQFF